MARDFLCMREPKMGDGNHITDWWLKILVGEVWVTVGETVHPKVHRSPHLWVAAKPHLVEPMRQRLRAFLHRPAPPPPPPPPLFCVLADFDGAEHGEEYLALHKGQRIPTHAKIVLNMSFIRLE